MSSLGRGSGVSDGCSGPPDFFSGALPGVLSGVLGAAFSPGFSAGDRGVPQKSLLTLRRFRSVMERITSSCWRMISSFLSIYPLSFNVIASHG